MSDPERKKLDDIVQREINEYLDRRSLIMLEAVIGCLLDTRSVEETVQVLRDFADDLEEYG